MVTVALPALPPLMAWITAVPDPVVGAVQSPVRLMDPGPITFDQVNAAWVVRGCANWSSACAAN